MRGFDFSVATDLANSLIEGSRLADADVMTPMRTVASSTPFGGRGKAETAPSVLLSHMRVLSYVHLRMFIHTCICVYIFIYT